MTSLLARARRNSLLTFVLLVTHRFYSLHKLSTAIDSPCECEHNNPDSLDAPLFPSVVSAVAPAVTMDEASSLSIGRPVGFSREC